MLANHLGWLNIENTNCFANLLPRSLQQDPGHRWTNLRNGELKDFFCCFHVFRAPHLLDQKAIVEHYLKLWIKPKNPESVHIHGVSQVETSWFGTAGTNFEENTSTLGSSIAVVQSVCSDPFAKKSGTHMTSFIVILSLSLIFQRHPFIKKTSRCKLHWQLSLRKWPCSEHQTHFEQLGVNSRCGSKLGQSPWVCSMLHLAKPRQWL